MYGFVIMGYGKKMDYYKDPNNKNTKSKVDLDKIYNNLITPSLHDMNIQGLRGDEISNSEVIDKDMFELLLGCEIVVADITTLNSNAMYELGVRHALKPYSTIILTSDDCNLPFDISHNRVFKYSLRDIRNEEKLKQTKIKLNRMLKSAIKKVNLKGGGNEKDKYDSPVYRNIDHLSFPTISKKRIEEIIRKHYNTETISKLLEKAKEFKKKHEYRKVADIFKKLASNNSNPYYVQQESLFLNKNGDYKEAENIINKLNPLNSFDSETTGLYGSVEKQLYLQTNSMNFLNEAIKSYNRGYILNRDYYNGENVVNCLIYKILNLSKKTLTNDLLNELHYLKYQITKINEDVLKLATRNNINRNENGLEKDYWLFATISLSYLLNKNNSEYQNYRKQFMLYRKYDWETNTYNNSKELRNTFLESEMIRSLYVKSILDKE
ncbi:hypothetical protein WR164_12520 [Philodulcilactobacillus myokoensis]|uniref:DUF4071 domain-containing protein n=1 Tax=Philodulcilactobacillus myokoensis TaxID=2929573 RepID=A0A9W6ETI2_9LACO|nr:tetratricopeptide repeat-containing protein [Philodulcilactobacillus myokoensis]GLB47273.1 hypothetical protein WR164_12520 [Philodulcilactobacillus myokoensis]